MIYVNLKRKFHALRHRAYNEAISDKDKHNVIIQQKSKIYGRMIRVNPYVILASQARYYCMKNVTLCSFLFVSVFFHDEP